ncbi:MAG: hypothetical protein ACRDLD_10545 [Thermoleophilaceae bacterium]
MAWEFSVMVVANVTATSEELLAALRERSASGACRFTLVMPRSGGRAQAAGSARGAAIAEPQEALAAALDAMRAAGLAKVSGRVGDPDPVVAAMELWDPREFDEIVVSTLPTGMSRWLGLDLPRRLEKLTSVSVRHVVAQPQSEVRWERPPEHEDYGVLSPLAAALTRRT